MMKNAAPKRRKLSMCLLAAAIVLVSYSSAHPQIAPAKPTSSASIVYVNKQFGFRFDLPASWKGYTIISKQESAGRHGTVPPENLEHYMVITIRHPLWKENDPRQDIPIMVLTRRQWPLIVQEKVIVSAAPFPPSELGRNSKYVFALPARYNYAFPTGFEEVEKIIKSKPLHPF